MLGALEITGSPKHAKDQVPFLSRYTSKTEFLSYVLLYLVKMPFPPVTRPRSLPSSGKEKLSGPSPVILVKTVEERSSVKERCKKATPHKSKLPTSRAPSGLRMEGKSTWIMTSRPADPLGSSTPTSLKSTSGNSTSTTNLATTSSVKSSSKKTFPGNVSATNILTNSFSPQTSSGSSHGLNSESNFSLNLTPEVTLLLQKRSREKQLRAIRGTITAPHQKDRLPAKPGSRSNIPLLKISLLNEHHRYDDVEYEEDKESVDQSVVLKCSEWLRGVKNTAGATVLGRVDKIS
ncbi:proline-rich protein 18 [Carassius carassius]|uniref:proline-rich protein 18 n=1 Tax=Carassius carassius TaxID=217509 RepID=UPI0028688004|nr:proline-rich protein 18 [Carassius carassius]